MILVNYRDLTTGKSTNIEHLEGLRYLLKVALLMSSKDFFFTEYSFALEFKREIYRQ